MNAALKRKIINHPLLYKGIVYLANIRYFLNNSSSVKGRNNIVIFKEGVLRKMFKLKFREQQYQYHSPKLSFKKYQDHHYGV